jgi:hypothetical protein
LANLPHALINLEMVSPLVEIVMQGDTLFRSQCGRILLHIWLVDHSILTLDSRLLELFVSFIPDLPFTNIWLRDEVNAFLDSTFYFLQIDEQLVLDSDLLKDLLRILPKKVLVIKFFLQILLFSILKSLSDENDLLDSLLDMEVLSSLINVLHDESWRCDQISEIKEEIKGAIRLVFMTKESSREIVSTLEMPEELRSELIGSWRGKRKRSEDDHDQQRDVGGVSSTGAGEASPERDKSVTDT